MFSWVCPRCGHDVPPSKTECPFCFPPVPEGAPVQPPVSTAPPQQYPPPPPPQQYAQQPPQPPYQPPPPQHQPYAPPPAQAPTPWPPPEERSGKPTWLVAVLAFAGVLAVFGIAYMLMGTHGSSSSAKDVAKQQTTNPLQKYVEVV